MPAITLSMTNMRASPSEMSPTLWDAVSGQETLTLNSALGLLLEGVRDNMAKTDARPVLGDSSVESDTYSTT